MDEAGEPHQSDPRRTSWTDWLLLGLAVTTTLLGCYGFAAHLPQSHDCGGAGPPWFLDPLYRTITLFEPSEANIRLGECYPYPEIAIARFTGIAALIVGGIRIFQQLFDAPIRRWRLSRARHHHVFLGFGDIGQARAIELADRGNRVVAVDASPNDVLINIAARHGILLVRGDARAPAVLRQARLDRAVEVTVALGDDSQSLAVAQLVDQWPVLSRGKRRTEVAITSPLIRRALSQRVRTSSLEVFSMEERAAARLCQTARFFEIADLLGQRRLHLVFVGFAPVVPSLAAHVLQSGVLADFDKPLLTIVSSAPGDARNRLLLEYPAITQLADLVFIACDPLLQSSDIVNIVPAAAAPVTAVVVNMPLVSANLQIALAIREAAHRSGHWQAPIFLGADQLEAIPDADRVQSDLHSPIETTRRFSQVLHAFEMSAHLTTLRAGRARDVVAKAIHAAYAEAFRRMTAAGQNPSQGGEALVDWDDLSHTYRQANRRVADHLPAKLTSAGCYVPRDTVGVPDGFDLLAQAGMLDRLSALEHDAWMVERQLDGWRYDPVRDNAERLHNDLVPFDQLPPETQELDRAQIRRLNLDGLPRVRLQAGSAAHLVRFDLWIGLTGQRDLTPGQADWVKAALQDRLLPDLQRQYPGHNVTLLSPLAPGAALVLTEAALEFLAAHPQQHRLLVTEGLPIRDMLEDFAAGWHSGAVGCLSRGARTATWPEARDALMAQIEALESCPACERILELQAVPPREEQALPPHEGQAVPPHEAHAVPPHEAMAQGSGYQRVNAYLAQRAHIMIVALAGTTSHHPGGTGEALAWRRDPAAIPPAHPRYLPRPNRLAEGTPTLIVLDAARREILPEIPAA